MSKKAELEEIAHTGGKVTFNVRIDAGGRISYNIEVTHSRPTPATVFAVYTTPQGIAVRDIKLGGIGTPWNPPPLPDCFPVFISSDTTGMFDRQCPSCNGYWRAGFWGRICPYCALEADENYHFLTEAQQRYVRQYCEVLRSALASGQAGEYIIDMDLVAEAAGKTVRSQPSSMQRNASRTCLHVTPVAKLTTYLERMPIVARVEHRTIYKNSKKAFRESGIGSMLAAHMRFVLKKP